MEIPVTIRSFRRLTHDLTVAFDLEVWGGALPYVDLEIEPREIVLPAGCSQAKALDILRVTLKRYDFRCAKTCHFQCPLTTGRRQCECV